MGTTTWPKTGTTSWPLTTLEQYQTALDRRRNDIASLADVTENLTAVDRQAAELEDRIAALIAMATSPG